MNKKSTPAPVCVVIGAARGLGAAVAGRLHASGATLVLVDRLEADLRITADALGGSRVTLLVEDLVDPAAPDRIWARVRECGGASVLINNAGIQGPIGPAWENDWTEWEKTIRVDLLAPVALCRTFVADWREAGDRGKIINLSGGGATGPRASFSAYAAAKAGLVRFSETLAEETRGRGIDVNCIAPGAMGGAMLRAVRDIGPELAGEKEFETATRLAAGTPDVIDRAAALCAYLASRASDGITGKLLSAMWDPWEALGNHLVDLRRTDVYTLRRIVPADRKLDW